MRYAFNSKNIYFEVRLFLEKEETQSFLQGLTGDLIGLNFKVSIKGGTSLYVKS